MAVTPIYHIIGRDDWAAAQAAGEYRAPSLVDEGFIHFSQITQILGVADRFYAGRDDLAILVVDPEKVVAEIRREPPSGAPPAGDHDGLFPHVYGALNLDAIVRVVPFPRNADGSFSLPLDLE